MMIAESNFPIIRTSQEEFKESNVGGKYRDIWTEIIIEAPPAIVRAKFVDLANRPKWDPFYRKFIIQKKNVDDHDVSDTTNIAINHPPVTIGLEINPECDGEKRNEFRVPIPIVISKNDDEGIIWGAKLLRGHMFMVDHVHLFQPINGGQATRLVNYERQSGPMRYFTNVKKYTRAFQMSNEALKKVCEDDQTSK